VEFCGYKARENKERGGITEGGRDKKKRAMNRGRKEDHEQKQREGIFPDSKQ